MQRQLAANRIACATGTHGAEPSLLAGLIYDDSGQRMTPSHANKKGTRYRYYVSQALVSGTRRSAPRARRVPAGDVERLVQERLTVFLRSQGEIFDAVEPLFDDVNRRQQVVELAADLAARWPDLEPATKRQIFKRLVNRINLTQETLEIRIAPGRLLEVLWEEDNPKTFEPALWDNELTVTFTVPAHLKRAGMETRLLIEGADGSARKSPDRSLLRLLSQAQRFHEMVLHNRGRTMTELAIEAGVGGSYFKPVQLIADAIRDVSGRGEIVLDVFGGSGSTLIAAEKTGRRARLCELDPVYCDRSRKIGAVIIGVANQVISTGFNGLPRSVSANDSRHSRDGGEKYYWFEHAERNALYNAARSGVITEGCKIYSSIFPCADCTRGIIQSGIVQLNTTLPPAEDNEFQRSFEVSIEMLLEADVELRIFGPLGKSE